MPNLELDVAKAGDEEIIALIHRTENWLFKVLSSPEGKFTSHDKEVIASHLGNVFSSSIIKQYMDIVYRVDGDGFVKNDVDVQSLPLDWDEYKVKKERKAELSLITIESKLNDPEMSATHSSSIKQSNGKLFFETFSAKPN